MGSFSSSASLKRSKKESWFASTIEDLDTAFGYFHYGDQLTIVSFAKISNGKEFSFIASNSKKNCYNVNMVYIESVMSINERSTIDFLLDNTQEKTVLESCSLAIWHIRRHGCIDGARLYGKKNK